MHMRLFSLRSAAILATAGLNDPRVGYWEAAKWVLRLRERATEGSGPILLYTNLDAGHAGASGRYQALEEQALRVSAGAVRCGTSWRASSAPQHSRPRWS